MDLSFSSLFDFSVLEWIIAGALLLFFLIQALFYFLLYKKPYTYEAKREKKDIPDADLPPVSVIIASKNESENLAKYLPSILGQDYPDFEVIVVNSGSTDETDMVLKALQQTHANLYHTYVPQEAEQTNERKLSLTLGIKAAKNDILLFTEAYCKPSSAQWIREFANEFAEGKDVVLGFCKLTIGKKVAMRRFILYDNLIHGLKYLSMAIAHRPFMGIGRNMAYKKALFFNEKGFSSILNVDGGEDDLFINRIANGKNTGVVVSPESMTESDVVENFFTWRALKSRYLYTKQFYQGARSFIFGWETFSKYLFYLTLVASLVIGVLAKNYILPALGILLFLIRFWFQALIINRNSRLFASGKFYLNLIFLDIFQPFNNLRFRKYANKRNAPRRKA